MPTKPKGRSFVAQDFRVAVDWRDQRATQRLEHELGAEGVLAWLTLQARVAVEAPTGRLEGWEDFDVCRAARWGGVDARLIEALQDARLIALVDDAWELAGWASTQPYIAEAEARSEAASKAAQSRWGAPRNAESMRPAYQSDAASMRPASKEQCTTHPMGNAEPMPQPNHDQPNQDPPPSRVGAHEAAPDPEAGSQAPRADAAPPASVGAGRAALAWLRGGAPTAVGPETSRALAVAATSLGVTDGLGQPKDLGREVRLRLASNPWGEAFSALDPEAQAAWTLLASQAAAKKALAGARAVDYTAAIIASALEAGRDLLAEDAQRLAEVAQAKPKASPRPTARPGARMTSAEAFAALAARRGEAPAGIVVAQVVGQEEVPLDA